MKLHLTIEKDGKRQTQTYTSAYHFQLDGTNIVVKFRPVGDKTSELIIPLIYVKRFKVIDDGGDE